MASTLEREIVGRGEQLDRLRTFLVAPAELPAALLLEGEAGIGKSTLWSRGVEEARAAGHRVLVCRPSAAEAALSYAALGDLLGVALDETRSARGAAAAGACGRAAAGGCGGPSARPASHRRRRARRAACTGGERPGHARDRRHPVGRRRERRGARIRPATRTRGAGCRARRPPSRPRRRARARPRPARCSSACTTRRAATRSTRSSSAARSSGASTPPIRASRLRFRTTSPGCSASGSSSWRPRR
jgi:hypothetical protein